MSAKSLFNLASVMLALVIIGLSSCERDLGLLEPASYPTNPDIFIDGFSGGLDYQAFLNTKLDAITIDMDDKYDGEASLRITVPSVGDPSGFFSGGAFVAPGARDLSGYNALTFWAKASVVAPVGLVGFGNDNSGNSLYTASRSNLVLTTTWQKYIVPVPDASKLGAEKGMFQYSAGAFDSAGFYCWFDEVQFEKLGTIAQPRAVISSNTISGEVGETIAAGVTGVIYDVNGVDVKVNAAPAYFTLTSSNENVATIGADGTITGVGIGTAEITVKLGGVEIADKITVSVVAAAPRPAAPAPLPTLDAGDVISMFSNAYNNVPVDTWDTGWEFSTANVEDVLVAGDDVKKYTDLNFVGIEFATQTIDATDMTNFHLDIWTPEPTAAPAAFRVLLVDFGPNGVFDGGDDSSHELTFTSPTLATEDWVSLDIPLAEFTGLTGREHLAQLVLSGDLSTVYVDNVYFHKAEGGGSAEPETPAPAPTVPAGNVVSLFSNAYTNVTVDTWSADWDAADVSDIQISGDDVKLYTNLVFAGIEFTSQPVDASLMTHFYMDIWTPNPTAAPAVFRIKLVDFGADGAFGGGDDVEHELTLDETTVPALASGSWVGLDLPLSSFTGLTTTGHLAQLIVSGDLGTVYMDNVYFYDNSGGPLTEPAMPAPTPGFAAGDVISLFSNAYTNVTVNTWSADWDAADVEDVQVDGDDAKLYTNLVFAGIEFTSPTIDATAMTDFYMNIWTADPVAVPAVFRIKLVDFGADGAFGGGDDVEHELTFDENSTPPLVNGQWMTFDIPLSDFTALVTRGHLAQLIIVADPGPNTMWVDNILLHK